MERYDVAFQSSVEKDLRKLSTLSGNAFGFLELVKEHIVTLRFLQL